MAPLKVIKESLSFVVAFLLTGWAVGVVDAQVDWKKDWERSLQEAKKEGKIVAGIPARAELRKQLEAVFKPKFSIDMELMTARGPQTPAGSPPSIAPA